MNTNHEIVIVGAGICGLTAARRLVEKGRDVVLIDAGRHPGGRMATRRFSGAAFDHGAQFVSVRSDEFATIVREWLDAGVATLWSHGFADGLTGDGSLLTAAAGGGRDAHTPARDGHPRYRGHPAMSAIPTHAASGLDVRSGVRATAVRRDDHGWEIETDEGVLYRGEAVVLTPPVAQSLALLAGGGSSPPPAVRGRLEAVAYAPCIALMAICDAPVDLPEPGVLRRANGVVEWIADNHAKGVSESGPAVTVHCSAAFSEARYDDSDEGLTASIAEALGGLVNASFASVQIKRWRYSRPLAPLAVGAWTEGLPRGLVLAGDAFAGARVEGAVLSGLAAARTFD